MAGNKFRNDEIKEILHLNFITVTEKLTFVRKFSKTHIWIAEENLLFSCLFD